MQTYKAIFLLRITGSFICPGPEVKKKFHGQLNWARTAHKNKLKYQQIEKFLALSLSAVIFILLINVKMSIIVGIF